MSLEHIDLEEDFGSASGYTVATDQVQVGNYLSEYTVRAADIAAWFKARCQHIALLKNLNVDEAVRGNGHGSELLEAFIAEAEANLADAIILVADSAEQQAEGFVLLDWYASYGFIAVETTGAGPIMVYPEALGASLKEALYSEA